MSDSEVQSLHYLMSKTPLLYDLLVINCHVSCHELCWVPCKHLVTLSGMIWFYELMNSQVTSQHGSHRWLNTARPGSTTMANYRATFRRHSALRLYLLLKQNVDLLCSELWRRSLARYQVSVWISDVHVDIARAWKCKEKPLCWTTPSRKRSHFASVLGTKTWKGGPKLQSRHSWFFALFIIIEELRFWLICRQWADFFFFFFNAHSFFVVTKKYMFVDHMTGQWEGTENPPG